MLVSSISSYAESEVRFMFRYFGVIYLEFGNCLNFNEEGFKLLGFQLKIPKISLNLNLDL